MGIKASKWLLLPLGLSLLLPSTVISAEDTTRTASKTSADFKDLAGVDAALKAKIDALLAKGVFEGVSDDSFGIDGNMTRAQMAKVLTLIYGVNIDNSVRASSFTDVKADSEANGWAIPYIEAAKKAGLIDGIGGNAFAPSDNATLGQFATALVKGLGKKVDVSGSPWYSDAVKQAIENKILPEGSSGDKLATRADLVVGAYGGQQVYEEIKQSTPTPTPTPTSTPTPTPTPTSTPTPMPTSTSTPGPSSGDTTAPSITAATVNGQNVAVTGGANGTISLTGIDYLETGTISVSEASTLTVTAIQGIDLADYPSLSFAQTLTAGSNTLDLIGKLGSLDSQGDGLSVNYLKMLSNSSNQLVISGTLKDIAGNSRAVTFTFDWGQQ